MTAKTVGLIDPSIFIAMYFYDETPYLKQY